VLVEVELGVGVGVVEVEIEVVEGSTLLEVEGAATVEIVSPTSTYTPESIPASTWDHGMTTPSSS